MPDSLPVHGDTIIVDMIRKFAQERLAPLAAEREKMGRIEPEIIRELELKRFGLDIYQGDALGFSLFRDGRHLIMWKELDKTLREIERYSPRDARRFIDFGMRLQRFAALVRPWLLQPPPTRSQLLETFERAGAQFTYDLPPYSIQVIRLQTK